METGNIVAPTSQTQGENMCLDEHKDSMKVTDLVCLIRHELAPELHEANMLQPTCLLNTVLYWLQHSDGNSSKVICSDVKLHCVSSYSCQVAAPTFVSPSAGPEQILNFSCLPHAAPVAYFLVVRWVVMVLMFSPPSLPPSLASLPPSLGCSYSHTIVATADCDHGQCPCLLSLSHQGLSAFLGTYLHVSNDITMVGSECHLNVTELSASDSAMR